MNLGKVNAFLDRPNGQEPCIRRRWLLADQGRLERHDEAIRYRKWEYVFLGLCLACLAWDAARLYADESAIAGLQEVIRTFRGKDSAARTEARRQYGILGRTDGAVRDALVDTMKDSDEDISQWASDTLVLVGRPAIGPLVGVLSSDRARDRRTAAVALDRIGITAVAGVPALTKLLKDVDPGVREAAVSALSSIRDKSAVPALMAVLREDSDQRVHLSAAGAFANFGADGKAAVPALLEVLKVSAPKNDSRSFELRHAASISLTWIGASAVPELSRFLEDQNSDPRARADVAHALGQMGYRGAPEEAQGGVRALSQALKDRDSELRRYAASALGQLGRYAKEALPALAESLKREPDTARAEAALAMYQIDPMNKQSVPSLVAILRDKDKEAIRYASGRLAIIGPDAIDAVPALTELLKDSDESVRSSAGIALASIKRKRE